MIILLYAVQFLLLLLAFIVTNWLSSSRSFFLFLLFLLLLLLLLLYIYIYIYIYISIAFAVVCGVRSLFVCLSLLVSSFVRLFAKHLYLSARSAKRSYYDDMEMIVICLSGTVCVVVDPKNRPKWILNIKTKSCPNFNSIY